MSAASKKNELHDWLKSLKVGDEVGIEIPDRKATYFVKSTVSRLETARGGTIWVGAIRFSAVTGVENDHGDWVAEPRRLRPFTEKMQEAIEKHSLCGEFKKVKPEALSLQSLRGVMALVAADG